MFKNIHGSLFSCACIIHRGFSPPSLTPFPFFLSLSSSLFLFLSLIVGEKILPILYWRKDFTHNDQAENVFSPSNPWIHTSYRVGYKVGYKLVLKLWDLVALAMGLAGRKTLYCVSGTVVYFFYCRVLSYTIR